MNFNFFSSVGSGSGGANTTELVTEVALGSMTGLVAGYTLKKLGQLLSFGLLVGYSGLQLAKMRGWVQTHQVDALTSTVRGLGEKGKQQLPAFTKYAEGFAKVGVPSVISFGGGFYVGFFYG